MSGELLWPLICSKGSELTTTASGGGPLAAEALTPRQAAGSHDEWPSRAQMHTVGGSRAESRRLVRLVQLSDCIHTTRSNCSQEACGGSGGRLVSQISQPLLGPYSRCRLTDTGRWRKHSADTKNNNSGRREQRTDRQKSLKVIDGEILLSIWSLF